MIRDSSTETFRSAEFDLMESPEKQFLSVIRDPYFLQRPGQMACAVHQVEPEEADPFHSDWPHWNDAMPAKDDLLSGVE